MMGRLAQEVIDELGAEVMVNAPRAMKRHPRRLVDGVLDSISTCQFCSLAAPLDARIKPIIEDADLMVVTSSDPAEINEAFRVTDLCLPGIDYSVCPTLICPVRPGSRLTVNGSEEQRKQCSQNVKLAAFTAAPSIIIAYGPLAAQSLGLPAYAWMKNQVAIWWVEQDSAAGAFVFLMPPPTADHKKQIFTRLYTVERALKGEVNLWDLIGKHDFCTEFQCSSYAERLDQNGLPWCKAHKPYTPPPTTLGRNRRR